jgi:hypothetical protein
MEIENCLSYNSLVKIEFQVHFKDRWKERVKVEINNLEWKYILDNISEVLFLKRSGKYVIFLKNIEHAICLYFCAMQKKINIVTVLPKNKCKTDIGIETLISI